MAFGIKAPKGGVTRVPSPRNNPAGRVRPPLGFPHVAPPRLKPIKTREYSKIPATPDPSQVGPNTGAGFGDTGMTGES